MNELSRSKAANPDVSKDLARALGWFSIGLGLAEALMPAKVSRASGINGCETLVRSYGAREIANGIAILTAKDPSKWVWARIAGDVMDVSTLASRGAGSGAALAFVAVAGVTALDVICANALQKRRAMPPSPRRDYSDRSGMPEPPERMRGAARRELIRARPPSSAESFATSP